jgi:prepilin-type N-terminal cleavage/methylation domain-containing protein
VKRLDRRGYTLAETLIVLGVAAVLFAIGWPQAQRLLLGSSVKSARGAVITFYQQARSRALQDARQTTVWFGQHNVWVTAKPRRTACAGCTYDTVGTVTDMNQRYGVTISATPDSFVVLNARGIGLTSNNGTTVVAVAKSSTRDTVRISQIGRITK